MHFSVVKGNGSHHCKQKKINKISKKNNDIGRLCAQVAD